MLSMSNRDACTVIEAPQFNTLGRVTCVRARKEYVQRESWVGVYVVDDFPGVNDDITLSSTLHAVNF